jgi:UDPglucose--hexose-1-phosphate uridylyltransferase
LRARTRATEALTKLPEVRKDPITGQCVIVSAERANRPSDFVRAPVVAKNSRLCPFCPGNESQTRNEVFAFRSSGAPNHPGWTTRVVPNRFPVLCIDGELNPEAEGLYGRMNGVGAHEVIIDCPEHVVSLAETSETNVANLFWAFRKRAEAFRRDARLAYTFLFKNHGEPAGASLEHSHSQLVALPVMPKQVKEEFDRAKSYFDSHEQCVFCDVIRQENREQTRVVMQDDNLVAIAPYASRAPYEMWVLPRKHGTHFERSEPETVYSLAKMLRVLLAKIDRTLDRPPYNLVLHNGGMKDPELPHYHWRLEIIPRLVRLAGFEWGTGFFTNPTTPEEAAKVLRDFQL